MSIGTLQDVELVLVAMMVAFAISSGSAGAVAARWRRLRDSPVAHRPSRPALTTYRELRSPSRSRSSTATAR
jgi:hypothetical protein